MAEEDMFADAPDDESCAPSFLKQSSVSHSSSAPGQAAGPSLHPHEHVPAGGLQRAAEMKAEMDKQERKLESDDDDDDDESFDFQGELYDLEDVAGLGGGAFNNGRNEKAFQSWESRERERGGLEAKT